MDCLHILIVTTFLFMRMNSQFQVVDSFYCGNGYPMDFHELQLLPNGHYLILGVDLEKVDMSKIVPGGDTSATVTGVYYSRN